MNVWWWVWTLQGFAFTATAGVFFAVQLFDWGYIQRKPPTQQRGRGAQLFHDIAMGVLITITVIGSAALVLAVLPAINLFTE